MDQKDLTHTLRTIRESLDAVLGHGYLQRNPVVVAEMLRSAIQYHITISGEAAHGQSNAR